MLWQARRRPFAWGSHLGRRKLDEVDEREHVEHKDYRIPQLAVVRVPQRLVDALVEVWMTLPVREVVGVEPERKVQLIECDDRTDAAYARPTGRTVSASWQAPCELR